MNIRLLLVLCVILSPVSGWADWIEVESVNFRFVGEVDEEDAREIVTDLEMYRRAILALAGLPAAPEIRKVHVYGMRNAGDVRELTGLSGIVGAYTLGDDYPVFVGMAGWTDDAVRPIMLHEYAHHLLRTYTTAYLPRWYGEGFAEYLGSLEVEDNLVSVGIPNSQFGHSLNRLKWIDIGFVLNSITEYPYESDDSWSSEYQSQMFYGISWLAVHYLQSTPELNKGFGDYIAQLNQGVDPTAAFEAGFGITQEEFGNRLRSYWRDNHFAVLQFQMTDAFKLPPVTVREMSEAEAEIALAAPRSLFVSRDAGKASERTELREDIQGLLKEYGPSPILYNALMGVEFKVKNYDGAVAIGEKAVSLAPNAPLSILTLADALYHRARADASPGNTDISRARELFSKLLDLDPTNPTANHHYPVTFILDDTEPDKQAIEAVAFNLRYRRNASYFDSHLDNIEVLSMAGRLDDACVLLSRVEHWIRVSSEKQVEKQSNEDRPRVHGQETRLERLIRLKGNFNGRCAAEHPA